MHQSQRTNVHKLRRINYRTHRLMKTSSIAVETSRSTSQSDSIVRQTNKRSFPLLVSLSKLKFCGKVLQTIIDENRDNRELSAIFERYCFLETIYRAIYRKATVLHCNSRELCISFSLIEISLQLRDISFSFSGIPLSRSSDMSLRKYT